MESSKVLGSTEEYSSSESGWTTYIASSIHEDNNCNDEDNDYNHSTDKRREDDGDDDNNESDDSMTSDASSRPSNPELLCGRKKGNCVIGHFKHAEDEALHKRSLGKKLYKQADEKIYGRKIKTEKDEPEHSASYAHVGAKVKKINKMDKG